jgi:hypothetical protein
VWVGAGAWLIGGGWTWVGIGFGAGTWLIDVGAWTGVGIGVGAGVETELEWIGVGAWVGEGIDGGINGGPLGLYEDTRGTEGVDAEALAIGVKARVGEGKVEGTNLGEGRELCCELFRLVENGIGEGADVELESGEWGAGDKVILRNLSNCACWLISGEELWEGEKVGEVGKAGRGLGENVGAGGRAGGGAKLIGACPGDNVKFVGGRVGMEGREGGGLGVNAGSPPIDGEKVVEVGLGGTGEDCDRVSNKESEVGSRAE